jgi:hypothetical protein
MLLDEILELIRAGGRLVESVVEKGWGIGLISSLGTLLYAVFKVRGIKRRIKRFAPYLFDDDPLPEAYVNNQMIIMENQRRIMAAMGVVPACPPEAPRNATMSSRSKKPSARRYVAWRTSSLGAFFLARCAALGGMSLFTKSIIRRLREMNMKKWIRPDTLTIFAGVLVAAANQYFGIQIDPANILGAAVLLLGYFKSHELITVVRDANGLPSSFRINSRKFIFTAVAFSIVVVNVAMKWDLPQDVILAIAGAVTGYNYLEAQKDAKTAEAEGADARQTF